MSSYSCATKTYISRAATVTLDEKEETQARMNTRDNSISTVWTAATWKSKLNAAKLQKLSCLLSDAEPSEAMAAAIVLERTGKYVERAM